MNWGKFLLICIPVFPVVLVINQAFYNFTFKGYALAAAFPKVCIFTGIISFVIYLVQSSENKPRQIVNVTPLEEKPQKKITTKIGQEIELVPSDEPMTSEEIGLVKEHIGFYESLELGIREPETDAQRHFLDVIRGRAIPRTKHERAFLKHMRVRENPKAQPGGGGNG